MSPHDTLTNLRQLGFHVTITSWDIADPGLTSGTTREGTVCHYKACFICNGHVVAATGHVYTAGQEPNVSAKFYLTRHCRHLFAMQPAVSTLQAEHLEQLSMLCDGVKNLTPAPPRRRNDSSLSMSTD